MEYGLAGTGTMKASSVFFRLLMLVVGLFLLVGSLFFANQTLTYLRGSVKTQGTVVRIRKVNGRHRNFNYAPVFAFSDAAGHSYTLISHNVSNPSSFAIGDTATVLYKPDDPQHARIDSFMELWAFNLGGVLVGGLFTGLSFWGPMWRSGSAKTAPASDGSGIVRG
jgi:hypothetical protein